MSMFIRTYKMGGEVGHSAVEGAWHQDDGELIANKGWWWRKGGMEGQRRRSGSRRGHWASREELLFVQFVVTDER